jgi:hypothetical protein
MSDSNPLKHQDISATLTPPKKKTLFSSKGHNMQYFDMEGIKQRTSYSNEEDLYTAVVKEQFDNQVDWLHDNYKGSKAEKIKAVITIFEDKVNYKFRNTNPANIEIEAFKPENLKEIFDFNKTYGSKQNRHVFGRRGLFGDASKFIAGIPYALIHSQGAQDNAFYNTQWKEPICYRANGVERQVLVKVNRAASEANVDVSESPNPVPHTDTEVEITIPIIKFDPTLLADKIHRYCQRYILCTRDISFEIGVINRSLGDDPTAHNAIRVILKDATEPIPEKSKTDNLPTTKSYTPEEFVRFFLGFEDRDNITVYDVLTELKEGTQIPKKDFDTIVKSDVYRLSLAEFIKDPKHESKLKSLYHRLRKKDKRSA